LLSALALVAAACSDDDTTGAGDSEGPSPASSIGPGEGELNLIAWIGYVEDGTTEGYENYDWITPFEKETGCKVNSKIADSSDEMYNLMTTQAGQWDGVSASGDSSNRLIASGAVAPIDPSLFDLSNTIAPLDPFTGTDNSHYVVDGNIYGVPWMYGPNFLMYNSDVVKPTPTSWDVVFETTLNGQSNPYKGNVTAYGFPIYIADAAIYLMAHQPDLGITDPYSLTEDQLNAATELLQQQRTLIDKYWLAYGTEIDGFSNGSMVAGTAWPVNLSLTEVEHPEVKPVEPSEGMSGWADTWMMSTSAPHPNCMLEWMQYSLRPEVQAETAEYYGAAASNTKACPILRKSLQTQFDFGYAVDTVRYGYCGDENFLDSLWLWRTPQSPTDYSQWTQKWTEIVGQ
jgi:putative spermidine/putrescine transport system substrate-binding protein